MVELLVVVAIIGILSTFVTINLVNSQKKARDSKRISDVESLKSAFVMYYEDFDRYPMVDNFSGSGGYAFYEENLAVSDPTISRVNFPKYLSPIPRDPKRLWYYAGEDPKNAPYRYAINGSADRFAFFINFEVSGTRSCNDGAWQLTTDYCGCKTGSSNLDTGWWDSSTPICQ